MLRRLVSLDRLEEGFGEDVSEEVEQNQHDCRNLEAEASEPVVEVAQGTSSAGSGSSAGEGRRTRSRGDYYVEEPPARRRRTDNARVRSRDEGGDDGEAPERRRMRLELLEVDDPVCIRSVFGCVDHVQSHNQHSDPKQIDIAEMFTPPQGAQCALMKEV